MYQFTFTFDNKIENEGNVNNEGADVTDENDGDSNGNDDNNVDDTGNDNGDDDNEDDGSTLIPANDEVYRVVNP